MTSNEDKATMKKVFIELDTNNDGKLSREELLEGYKRYMPVMEAENEVERIMNLVDTDQSGFIDFSEFITATMDRKKVLSKEKIEAAFAAFDKDGSGSISSLELKELLGGEAKISN